MPQPRRYTNHAAQQAVYRERQARQHKNIMASKGLPALPAIPSIPGSVRWEAMLLYAQSLLNDAAEEMQCYHDDRSEQWQESEKAEALLEYMASIQSAAETVTDLL